MEKIKSRIMNSPRNFPNLKGESTLASIVLTILVVSAIGGGVYLYFEKEKITDFHLKKVETLNKKIVTLSEHLKKRDVENLELKNQLEGVKKSADEFKKKYEETAELNLTLTEIQSTLSSEFLKMTKSLQTGFSMVENFSRVFDSRIENYLNKNKRELNQILEQIPPPTVTQSRGQVELPEIVVSPEETTPQNQTTDSVKEEASSAESQPAQQAQKLDPKTVRKIQKAPRPVRVMKVNQEHGFFVVNKGMIDGMKVGVRVEVARENVKIGEAIVTEVRELISLAEIKVQLGGNYIESGDAVRFLRQ